MTGWLNKNPKCRWVIVDGRESTGLLKQSLKERYLSVEGRVSTV